MLQTQSVYPATLGLLEKLMCFEPLNDFNLVGGTALALQFGHRVSVDLDFFTKEKFNVQILKEQIEDFIKKENHELEWIAVEETALIAQFDNIKVDFVRYPYGLIDELIVVNDIRLLSPKDIAPMKLSAIAQRGAKKDFFDFYKLLEIFTLDEMVGFYEEKFPDSDSTYLIRALNYFEDAEIQKNPIMLKDYNWSQVKKRITKEVKSYINRKL